MRKILTMARSKHHQSIWEQRRQRRELRKQIDGLAPLTDPRIIARVEAYPERQVVTKRQVEPREDDGA